MGHHRRKESKKSSRRSDTVYETIASVDKWRRGVEPLYPTEVLPYDPVPDHYQDDNRTSPSKTETKTSKHPSTRKSHRTKHKSRHESYKDGTVTTKTYYDVVDTIPVTLPPTSTLTTDDYTYDKPTRHTTRYVQTSKNIHESHLETASAKAERTREKRLRKKRNQEPSAQVTADFGILALALACCSMREPHDAKYETDTEYRPVRKHRKHRKHREHRSRESR